MAVLRGEHTFGMVVAVVALCAALAIIGWGVTRGAAQVAAEEEESVGRYQVAVPDLILDTATGRLTGDGGKVLETPIDPSGEEVGRYSVDGYVTAVTRRVGLDVINQPVAYPELVKGYVLADTKTGRIIKTRVYYAQPLTRDDM